MRRDTRIAVLAGLLCLLSAGWYFRVFRPAELHPGILVDFTKSPAEPSELTFAQWLTPPQPKSYSAKLPLPKQERSTQRMALPSPPKPKIAEPKPAVPETPPTKSVEPKPEPAKPQPRIYTVKHGDSLWRIARDQLGEPARHVELFELNESALHGDPDNLTPGQKLILPPK